MRESSIVFFSQLQYLTIAIPNTRGSGTCTMSSSFSDRRLPSHPPSEDAYTTAPLPAERQHQGEDDADIVLPKLGSLAQKARGKKLKQARGILLFLGILTILWNGVFFFLIPTLVKGEIDKELVKLGGFRNVDPLAVEKARSEMEILNYAITSLFFFTGVAFVIFGVLVYRFPLAMTIGGLVLYLLATVAMAALNPALLVSGAIIRIVFIVALAKSIQSAYAYEKERRAEEEYELDG